MGNHRHNWLYFLTPLIQYNKPLPLIVNNLQIVENRLIKHFTRKPRRNTKVRKAPPQRGTLEEMVQTAIAKQRVCIFGV